MASLDQQIDHLADEAARALAEAVIAETPDQAAEQVFAACRGIIVRAVRLGQNSVRPPLHRRILQRLGFI